jgi:hypothetical protein
MQMRTQESRRRRERYGALVAAVAASAVLSACGGGHHSATTKTSTGPKSTTTTTARAASSAAVAVRSDWEAFFDGKTPVARRVALLQDGSRFASIISAQSGSPLAAAAGAKVDGVILTSPDTARVTYSITEDGQTALAHQTGTAVRVDGTWKVGVGSFCGLLTLENGGKTSGLPAACRG